jgi:superfamily I DNA and/or RNA helicase
MPDTPPRDSNDHFQHLLRLMALEAEAEAEQIRQRLERFSGPEAERSGQTLVQLVIRAEAGGLGGRSLLTFGKRNVSQPLPWHRLRVGSPVLLSEEGGGPARKRWRGVVSEQRRENIQVAFESWPESETERATFRLDISDDEIGRRRERAALHQAQAAKGDRLAELRRVLLLEQPPAFGPEVDFTPLNPSLNPTQQAAVRLALSAKDVALIHGPPGTGKTTAVVELIRQAVRRGERVLACAPSNIAVDNIFERLLAAGEKAIRLGHPARVLPELRGHTLDLMVENHPDVRTARKLARESYALRDKAGKYSRTKPAPGAKREMRSEAKAMLADARRLEAQTVERILDAAQVLCVTTTGLSSKILGPRRFDLCVLDEAAQSTEPGAWIPLLRSERLVLAGDPCQLPPTIISPEAARQGFGISLMERLMTDLAAQVSRRLTVQYRMHREIMAFSSAEFYDDQLEAEASVAGHLLADLPGVANTDLTRSAVHFIDTAGAGYDEALEPDGESRLNPQEAALVAQKVAAFLEAGVSPADMAVITPYAAQVRLLRELLPQPGLEIDSVDGFQGREKEAVIISLVRSNPAGEIGFLADTRRMNVALSRARRKLLVIGDSATISSEPFYQRLVEYFELIGAYQSVWEELEW